MISVVNVGLCCLIQTMPKLAIEILYVLKMWYEVLFKQSRNNFLYCAQVQQMVLYFCLASCWLPNMASRGDCSCMNVCEGRDIPEKRLSLMGLSLS